LKFIGPAQVFKGIRIEDKIQISFSFHQKGLDHLSMVLHNSLDTGDGVVFQ
jgi:hypothetical protein